jgi:hypothetical protein
MPAVAERQSAVVDGHGESGHLAGQPTNSGGQTLRKITEQWRATHRPSFHVFWASCKAFWQQLGAQKLSKLAGSAAWCLVQGLSATSGLGVGVLSERSYCTAYASESCIGMVRPRAISVWRAPSPSGRCCDRAVTCVLPLMNLNTSPPPPPTHLQCSLSSSLYPTPSHPCSLI